MAVLPPLLLAIPLLAAALVRVPAVWTRRRLATAVAVGAAAVVAVLAGVLTLAAGEAPVVHWVGGWEPREGVVIGIALVADGLAAGFIAFAAALVAVALWHALGSYERTGGMFEVLTLLLLVALSGFTLSADLFSMFVFIELLGITVYALTASKIDDRAAVPGAVNIAVISTFGAMLFLTGVALVYGAVDTPNLAAVGERLAELPTTPAVGIGVALLAAGLAVKAGLAPFHFGHLDAHTVARAPHAGLFGAVTVPVGLFGLLRLQTVVAPGLDPDLLRPVLLAAAVVTAVVGSALAVAQTHLKRLLACSSVAHTGIAGVGIALGSPEALTGTAVYVLGHGALKLGLFLAVGVLLHRLGSVETGELVGRAREARLAAGLLAVGGPLLAGLPPSGLHTGKATLAEAASAAELAWVGPLLYGAAALTGVALVRAAVHLWWAVDLAPDPHGRIAEGSRETIIGTGPPPVGFATAPVLLVTAAVAPVLLPGAVTAVAAAVDTASAPGAMAAAVDTASAPVGEFDASGWSPPIWTSSAVVGGAGSGVVAVVGGALLAARGRAGLVRVTLLRSAGRGFRRLHSGHVGDYTAWATLGAGVWCGWVLVAIGIGA